MKKFIYIIIFICIVAGIFRVWYDFSLFLKSGSQEDKVFIINSGESTKMIAERLAEEGLIRSDFSFRLFYFFNKETKIQAGEYIIGKNSRAKDVINQFSKGEIAEREVSILIREGLSVREINEYLKKQGYLNDDSFINLASTYEGYLFPDTYRMYKGFKAEDLVEKMRANFEKKITSDLKRAMDDSSHKPEEIIIMASLLEKEVRTEEDMKIVAGIFWDRLKIGQALQSCATLAYILGVNKAQYSYEDTQIVSPYNTYKNPGLPPRPINNPGLRAIKAAIYPTKTEYNYFLSRPDTGETIFSKTLEEHNAAKAKYLK